MLTYYVAQNGGHIRLTKHWARYLLSRMGFVKQRANTKSKVCICGAFTLYLLNFNNPTEMDDVPP